MGRHDGGQLEAGLPGQAGCAADHASKERTHHPMPRLTLISLAAYPLIGGCGSLVAPASPCAISFRTALMATSCRAWSGCSGLSLAASSSSSCAHEIIGTPSTPSWRVVLSW